MLFEGAVLHGSHPRGPSWLIPRLDPRVGFRVILPSDAHLGRRETRLGLDRRGACAAERAATAASRFLGSKTPGNHVSSPGVMSDSRR
jgi:hypothetical protein